MNDQTQVRRLMRMTGWALLALAVATLVRTGLVAQAIAQLRSTGLHDDAGAVIDRLHFYIKVLPPLSIVSLLFVAIFAALLARAGRGSAGWTAGIAAALLLLVASIDTLGWLGEAAGVRVSGSLMRTLYTVDILGEQAALALLLAAAVDIARRYGSAIPASLPAAAAPFIAWPVIYWLRMLYGSQPFDESPWVGFFAGWAIWGCGVAWVAYVCFRVGGRTAASVPGGEPRSAALGGEWRAAVDGLGLYADALSWRLALTIIGYVLLLLAVLGMSQSLAKLVAWLLPLSLAVTSAIMAVGVFRFSRQPGYSPARGTAAAAFAATLVSLALQAWGFLLVLRLLLGDPSSYRKMRELGEQAQSMDTWAMAAGFLALVLLLVSYAQLANYLAAPKLFGRVIGVASAIVLLAFAVLGFRAWLSSSGAKVTTLLSMAILLLGFALFAVIAYIQLTRAVEQALRERLVDTDAPPVARVVSE